jgi:hypothetical protein
MNNKDDDVGNVPVYVTLSVDDGDDVVSNVSVTSFRPPEVNDRRPAYSNGSLDGSMEYSASVSVESHNDASPPPSPSDAPLPRRGAPTSSVDSVDSFPVNARAKYKAPKQAFDFHICKLPLLRVIDRHVDLKELEGLEFVAEGSHSEVYAATWRGKTVIVKVRFHHTKPILKSSPPPPRHGPVPFSLSHTHTQNRYSPVFLFSFQRTTFRS